MHTVESPGFAVHPVMPVADLNTCCKTQGQNQRKTQKSGEKGTPTTLHKVSL